MKFPLNQLYLSGLAKIINIFFKIVALLLLKCSFSFFPFRTLFIYLPLPFFRFLVSVQTGKASGLFFRQGKTIVFSRNFFFPGSKQFLLFLFLFLFFLECFAKRNFECQYCLKKLSECEKDSERGNSF